MLTSCFRMAPKMAVADCSWWARKSQYSQATARFFSPAWSHRLSIARELIFPTRQRHLPSPLLEQSVLTLDMSFPRRDPQNKIAPTRGIHPLRYSISETRWFLETNPPHHQVGRLARLGAAAEALEAITTPGSDYPHRISLC